MISEYLANDALIVHNKPFQEAMLKTMNGDQNQLNSNNRKAAQLLSAAIKVSPKQRYSTIDLD